MELRKDYILDRWVIIASERKKRPKEFKKIKSKKEGICYFCPGNEDLTPEETGRIERNNKWIIRWFPNKFPAVSHEGNPEIKCANEYFTYADAFGIHEIIVETPDHDKQLADLTEEHIKEVLKVYANRIRELSKIDSTKYVLIFKNEGMEAGTSLIHSHTQVMAYNKVPKLVEDEVNASRTYRTCPHCEIINIEKKSYRRVFENNSFVSFTPYASRFNYEIWIFPKDHIRNITEMNEKKLLDLASMLKKILLKLKKINLPYNFFLHYAPEGKELHFHIEICPRLATWAGFELATNATINSVSPEDAAKFYRGEK